MGFQKRKNQPKCKQTIIVTDSGLGGLSVTAGLINESQKQGIRTKIIFFNSLFSKKSGYNDPRIKGREGEYFDRALEAMMGFHPEAIAIACNTLSLIYPQTHFAGKTPVKVFRMTNLALRALAGVPDNEESAIVLLATPLTVEKGVYQKALKKKFNQTRIIAQPCPGLTDALENVRREKVKALSKKYLNSALKKAGKRKHIFLSLNCTHLSYLKKLFRKILPWDKTIRIIDPNRLMLQALKREFNIGEVVFELISKTPINKDFSAFLPPRFRKNQIISGLRSYSYKPNLF